MKKLLLSSTAIALLASVFVSCGENKESKTETTETTTTTTVSEQPAETTVATPAGDAPTFSNEEVNKGLAEYRALITAYTDAYKSKDHAKIAELSTKAQEVSKNMQSWMSKLKPEEMQQFTDYWQKLSQEWTAAATAAAH